MKRIFSESRMPFSLTALSASAFALPFQVQGLWVLTFVAPVLLLCALHLFEKKAESRRTFALGFGFGFFYHLCLYHWLVALHPLSAAGMSGALSVFVVCLAYVGACAIHALLFGAGFFLWGVLCKKTASEAARLFLFVPCFVIAEYLTNLGALAMPWSRIGLPLAQVPVFMRLAALVGPWGVDAFLLVFGALCALCICRVGPHRLFSLALAVLLFVSNFVFGLLWGAQTKPERTLTVSVVQTNVTYEEKWNTSPALVRDNVSRLVRLAAEAEPDVILLPESVLATLSRRGDRNEEFFASLSEEVGAVIVAGAVFSEEGKTYNAVCLYDEGGLVDFNAKRHLVPFGEYLPYKEVLSVVLPMVANMDYYRSSYEVGEGGVIGNALGTALGGMVCFDTLFTELSRASVEEGAEILFACTNDAWFKSTPAAREHLYQGVWRAVETSRAFCQAANVGISALVLPTGEIAGEVALCTQGVATASLPLAGVRTPYSVTGDLIVPCSVLSVCTAFVYTRLKKRGEEDGK